MSLQIMPTHHSNAEAIIKHSAALIKNILIATTLQQGFDAFISSVEHLAQLKYTPVFWSPDHAQPSNNMQQHVHGTSQCRHMNSCTCVLVRVSSMSIWLRVYSATAVRHRVFSLVS